MADKGRPGGGHMAKTAAHLAELARSSGNEVLALIFEMAVLEAQKPTAKVGARVSKAVGRHAGTG